MEVIGGATARANSATEMSSFTEDRRGPRPSDRKALHFALIMLGGCVAVSLIVGVLLRQVGPPRSVAVSPRPDMAAPASRAAASVPNVLVYHADAAGCFFIDAAVNGTTIRFLLDTGATDVVLGRDDARAAGIGDDLDFSTTIATAGGQAPAARASLRSLRLDQFEVQDVPAMVVTTPIPVSLLGMSFLDKLKSYSIRDGVLTIEW